MVPNKRITMLYGRRGLQLRFPEHAAVLATEVIPPLPDPVASIGKALAKPIGCLPLSELLARKRPRSVAITISDITRPVPNKVFLPPLLELLSEAGIADERICVIIGTGMHRPSSEAEKEILVGRNLLERLEVIDHVADDESSMVDISRDPLVRINRRFLEADFRIVTGYIEPHFMAGFSGGRKGVCPALVDLATIQRFHGFETLANPKADNGILDGNPCHEIALAVARNVEVDFLLNVALTQKRETAGLYCGDLEQAHLAGCREVARWTTTEFAEPFDLVVTNGGGFPLDLTFYQTVKGMCTALPALHGNSTMLQVSECAEKLGSREYTELMLRWGHDWKGFMKEIEEHKDRTELDQWELQMQCRVLKRIGRERLLFVSDGVPEEIQRRICVNPVLGTGSAKERAQRVVDEFVDANPAARIAVIPDGPYTMLDSRS
jgi:nickel-dependent lactate racemase